MHDWAKLCRDSGYQYHPFVHRLEQFNHQHHQTTSAQSGARLPESGVCDAATWQRLLGPGATPDSINDVWGDNDFDADLGEERRGVFLIGEQRWEDPMKLAKIREKRAKEAVVGQGGGERRVREAGGNGAGGMA